jgi:hypothetical protein
MSKCAVVSDLRIFLFLSPIIPLNKSLATHYSKLTADQDHAQAQINSSPMLCNGDGIPMNRSLGAHCFKLSAGHAFSPAQYVDAFGMVALLRSIRNLLFCIVNLLQILTLQMLNKAMWRRLFRVEQILLNISSHLPMNFS